MELPQDTPSELSARHKENVKDLLLQHIRSKMLPDNIMFDLFEVVRRDRFAEGLIDYLAELMEVEVPLCNEEVADLQKEVETLKEKIEMVDEMQDTIDSFEENETCRSENLQGFIEEFQETNDRYPCIDEVWEAAWEKGREVLKKE